MSVAAITETPKTLSPALSQSTGTGSEAPEHPTTLRVAPPSAPRRSRRIKDTIVIFSQVFIPDPASVGQHIADVAFELVRRGYRVRVYTSRRGYDDPTQKYPKRE